MKKHKIEITETLQRVVEVEAESADDAQAIVYGKYKKCEIVLDESDFVDKEIDVYHDERNTPSTVFTITKEEVKNVVVEMIGEEQLSDDAQLNEKQITDVLSCVECDEFLAKDIQKSIRGAIAEVLK